jgi:hypothetical protein
MSYEDCPTRTLHDVAHAEAWRALWLSRLFPPGPMGGRKMLRRPELTSEQAIAAVKKHGGVTRAARALGVAIETVNARLRGGW